MGTIVVGIDGSDRARAALGWAVEEAKLRGDRVLAVHAWEPPVVPAVDITAGEAPLYVPELVAQVKEGADALVEREVREGAREPGVEVEPLAVEGAAAEVLVSWTPRRTPTCSSSARVAPAASSVSWSAQSPIGSRITRRARSSSSGAAAMFPQPIPGDA